MAGKLRFVSERIPDDHYGIQNLIVITEMVLPLLLSLSGSIGYRFVSLPAEKPLDIDLANGKYQVLFLWDPHGDDDPGVSISYKTVDLVQHERVPVLSSSAFVFGSSVRFQAKKQLGIQMWVLPSKLCRYSTYVYSTSISLSDDFTLAQSYPSICFFFDNPSEKSLLRAEIRQLISADSTIQVYDSTLAKIECAAQKCETRRMQPFFVKFTEMRRRTRIRIEAHFQGHDTSNICGCEPVLVYSGNETVTQTLRIVNQDLVCDDSFKIEPQQKKSLAYVVVIGTAAVLILIGCLVRCRLAKPAPKKNWSQEEQKGSDFRENEVFKQVLE
jgi:hypothetical protein